MMAHLRGPWLAVLGPELSAYKFSVLGPKVIDALSWNFKPCQPHCVTQVAPGVWRDHSHVIVSRPISSLSQLLINKTVLPRRLAQLSSSPPVNRERSL